MLRRRQQGRVSFANLVKYWLLVVPLAWSSQQQEYQAVNGLHGANDVSNRVPIQQRNSAIGVDIENKNHKHLKDTHIDYHNPSALQTFAPAHQNTDGIAVRAPSPAPGSGIRKPAGISSLHHARRLQDWEVEDLILLATVDGSLYARDRTTGKHKWGPILADCPVVETIYHRDNASSSVQSHSDNPLDDLLWIVEPVQDGEIYLYNKMGPGVLQKLHMTVKDLQERTPHASEEPPVVYVADKSTTLFSFDVGTGEWLKAFGSGGSMRNDKTVCRREGFEGLGGYEGQECGSLGLLTLGRVIYTIHIKHRDSSEPICTIKYSEWVPNLRDSDLRVQHKSSMDESYIISGHDGSVLSVGYRNAEPPIPLWQHRLPSPVVRIFDVARPVNSDSRNAELVILPQPIVPANLGSVLGNTVNPNDVFVNHTAQGGWYALSEQNYPMVTNRVNQAQCYDSRWPNNFLSPADLEKILIGVHPLDGASDPEYEAKPPPLAIGGPAHEQPVSKELGDDISTPLTPAPTQPDGYYVSRFTVNFLSAISLLVIALLTYIVCFFDRSVFTEIIRKRIAPNVQAPAVQTISPQQSEVAENKAVQAVEFPRAPNEQISTLALESTELLKTPEEKSVKVVAPSDIAIVQDQTIGQEAEIQRLGSADILASNGLPSGIPSEVKADSSSRQVLVHIDEPDAIGDNDVEALDESKKKTARRGTRGGKTHRRKNKNKTEERIETIVPAEVIVEKALEINNNEPARIEPDAVTVIPGGSDPTRVNDTTLQIGQLTVFEDRVLGFGSHGTRVFRGSFGGRDVAVKVMLKQLYDIASHEVTVLQESDDHQNVVRYFMMESAGDFMYIALELCPASLADVIDRPSDYAQLLGPSGLDLVDALRQITLGIRHLHSLKIVHRDIKPENILIAQPKRLLAHPGRLQSTRLLISDFGLCKKLEVDQSSFRATTAHAAGTSGWRAPELLVDDENNEPEGQEGAALGTQYSTNSEPVVVDTTTNRRVTRAIDIFALGCVFYYVLSKGNHPFDGKGRGEGKYMREANIIRGNHMLEDLSVLGAYQGEAHDLIAKMLAKKPKERPDASAVLAHPFFWSPADRLDFLCHVSDQFEFEPRDPPSLELRILESVAPDVIEDCRHDFLRKLPSEFVATLGKQRRYKGDHMLDLLRALRNKKNHYEDMPDGVKAKVGSIPEGYLIFWTERFPKLLMKCHEVIKDCGWENKDRFRKYYEMF